MGSHYYQAVRGIRKASVYADGVPAAIDTTYTLFAVSAGRTVIIRKIMGYRDPAGLPAGNAIVTIGVGALGPGVPANIIPNIVLLAGLDNEWEEDLIPEVEINVNIVYSSTVTLIQLQIEVEEIYI